MKIKNEGLKALTVQDEQNEIEAVGMMSLESMTKGEKITLANGVTLERTFDQKTYDSNLKANGVIQYFRVIAPEAHKNYQSDLSIEGLKEWGII